MTPMRWSFAAGCAWPNRGRRNAKGNVRPTRPSQETKLRRSNRPSPSANWFKGLYAAVAATMNYVLSTELRCYGGFLLAAFLERRGDEAGSLHLVDELAQIA